MRTGLIVLAMGLGACTGSPPRAADAPPDLLVVVVPSGWGATPPAALAPHVLHFPQAQPVHTQPAPAWRSLITGQWPGTVASARPNTVQSVLGLYGYRTVGRAPDVAADPADRFLADGLDAAPFSADGCLAEHLSTFEGLHPTGSDTAVFGLLVAEGTRCDPASDQAALVRVLTGPKRPHLVTAVVGLTADDWRSPGGAVPLYLAGEGFPAGSRDGFASVVDLVPTLLSAAGAVVPSDAIGTSLRPAPDRATGPQVIFQQAPNGTLGVRTPDHLLVVTGVDAPLPEVAPPSASVMVLPLTETSGPVDAVVAPLYQALYQWDRQRRATSAADRMGSDAFRELLRDQGYWH